MRTLPLNKRFNGFTYTQLRGKRSCIFRQEVTPEIHYYEVFKIRYRNERIIKVKGQEKKIEAGEIWPNDEAFGYWAWSCRTLERALERFNELENYYTKCLT